MRRLLLLLIISLSDLLIGRVVAQRSPFNGLNVLLADSNGHYRILIGGHFHGESTNRSGYPAATLLANLDTINKLGANLFLSTGDLFMDPRADWDRYHRSFFGKLTMPYFDVLGNHDMTSDTIYKRYGFDQFEICVAASSAWGKAQIMTLKSAIDSVHGDYFDPTVKKASTRIKDEFGKKHKKEDYTSVINIFGLNLEDKNGEVSRHQVELLNLFAESSKEHQESDPRSAKALFIISHRPIWAEDDPEYSDLFKGNTRSLTGTNFKKDVYPLLQKIAEHAHVYWISGSMGGFAPSSIFFQPHAKNITFIQCAIRDEPRDALLIADVWPDTVKWSDLSLTGQKLMAPEKYDAAWWRAHLNSARPGFNWRLLPYRIKTTVLRAEFWWGLVGGILVLVVVRRLVRRW